MINQDIIEKHIQAGKIAATCLQYGKSLIKPGAKIKDILDSVENKISEMGGKLAFPAQISLNSVAAHACAELSDETVLKDEVIKLDVGVHIDGYIADNALTVDLSGKYSSLIEANKKALDEALKLVKPGVSLSEIGKKIHEVITEAGFSPVRNLSGHGLGHYKIHTSPSIPNFDNGNQNVLQEGMVIAIEPFASTGAGVVQEAGYSTVFTLVKDISVRDPITRKMLLQIKKYKGLPFAKRWLEREFGSAKTNFALRQLVNSGCLEQHPPLVDKEQGIVSQAEHSVIVLDEPIVFTRLQK
ncbi:type II methionyl aminopeptidase [Candidatus Woesearchaeota archaeon]|jgi:methionyl aminopeptidase|nr:type II methionyl aminopeptidase [Candidatus Woesearchaeota archaeon]MBT5740099.1 type II methionyl aminopeptidase [Candidatus Woesearchaeota archaeon]